MLCNLFIVFLALQTCSLDLVAAEKKYRLSVLNFNLITGSEPRNGKHCIEAVNMVYDLVNQRKDILPNYNVEAYFADEGANSMMVPKDLINYVRSFEDQAPNVHQAPVATGVVYTPGCKTLGSMLHHVNMVGNVYACLSPSFTTNRVLYPNMYRSMVPTEKAVSIKLAFIKNIGKWSQIALLVNAINPMNTAIATKLMDDAPKVGISIAWFDSVLSVDEPTIVSLKASGLRIILLEISEGDFLFQFLCSAYRHGIKGNRYRFIILMAVFFDPATLPQFVVPGCPKTVIQEQFQITFFIGASLSALANYGNTTLGYDREGFDKLFDKYSTGPRKPDYGDRYTCHDRALQALLTLDGTEKMLAKRNMSLRDMKARPREIMEAANISMANIDFFGVRSGRVKYSENSEYETDQFIASWSPSIGLHLFYRISHRYNSSTALAFQDLEQISPIEWGMPDGRPPFDEARQLIVNETISLVQFSTVTSTAAFLCLVTISWCSIFVVKFQEPVLLPICKLFLAVGFLLTEGGAVAFVVDSRTEIACIMRFILSVLGVSLINGIVCSNLVNLMKVCNHFGNLLFRQLKNRALVHNNELEEHLTKEVVHNIRDTQQRAVLGGLAFALLNVALVVACLVTSPMKPIVIHITESTFYDESKDIAYHKYMAICYSEDFPIWIAVILAVNFGLLIWGLFAAYHLRRAAKLLQSAFPAEIKHLQMGVVNATAIQLVTFFILFTRQDDAIGQQLVLAVSLLVFAISLALPFFIASLKLIFKIQ